MEVGNSGSCTYIKAKIGSKRSEWRNQKPSESGGFWGHGEQPVANGNSSLGEAGTQGCIACSFSLTKCSVSLPKHMSRLGESWNSGSGPPIPSTLAPVCYSFKRAARPDASLHSAACTRLFLKAILSRRPAMVGKKSSHFRLFAIVENLTHKCCFTWMEKVLIIYL